MINKMKTNQEQECELHFGKGGVGNPPKCTCRVNEIKKQDLSYCFEPGKEPYDKTYERLNNYFSSSLTELLQSLIVELEEEKDEKVYDMNDDWNQALNLAQEKLRKLIK